MISLLIDLELLCEPEGLFPEPLLECKEGQ